jgi:hypothetical protein
MVEEGAALSFAYMSGRERRERGENEPAFLQRQEFRAEKGIKARGWGLETSPPSLPSLKPQVSNARCGEREE